MCSLNIKMEFRTRSFEKIREVERFATGFDPDARIPKGQPQVDPNQRVSGWVFDPDARIPKGGFPGMPVNPNNRVPSFDPDKRVEKLDLNKPWDFSEPKGSEETIPSKCQEAIDFLMANGIDVSFK